MAYGQLRWFVVAVGEVVRGEQDAIVDGGAELHGIDNQITDEVHGHARVIGDAQVNPDARFDGQDEHGWQRQRAECDEQDQRDGDDRHERYADVVHRHDVLHVVEVRALPGGVVAFVVLGRYVLHRLYRRESLVAFDVGVHVRHDARVIRRIELLERLFAGDGFRDGRPDCGGVREHAFHAIEFG